LTRRISFYDHKYFELNIHPESYLSIDFGKPETDLSIFVPSSSISYYNKI
jgi:hypothetical protein